MMSNLQKRAIEGLMKEVQRACVTLARHETANLLQAMQDAGVLTEAQQQATLAALEAIHAEDNKHLG